MDLDDLDEATNAPSKPARFAPKSKFQPKSKQPPKAKPEPKPEPPAQGAAPPSPVVVVKKEEECAIETKEEEAKAGVAAAASSSNNGGGGDAMEEDKVVEEVEEDYVVAEYDVYFTPSSSDFQLYVLQYPNRPSWRPYDLEQRCTEVRVKPTSAEVEIDLSIETDSDYFDRNSPYVEKLKKQTLCSTWRAPQATGYGVGLLTGKKLYLNPIRAVVQLRTSMEYLDSGSKKKNIPDIAVKAEGSSSAVPVGSSRKQSQQMDADQKPESWIPVKYHSSTSELSGRYLRKMVTGENNSLEFPMNPYDYLNSLCPATATNKSKARGPFRRSLLSLPLEERLKTWLIEGPPVQRFSVLKYLAPDDAVEDVLQVLERYARLVQGLWVAKTLLRHPKAQQPAPLARDYFLLLFTRNAVIKDSELDIFGSHRSIARGVLKEVAVERQYCKDWKFKEPADVSFLKSHPDVVEQQMKLWQGVEEGIQATLSLRSRKVGARSERPEKIIKTGSSTHATHGDEGLAKDTNGAHTVKMSMSKETREALPKVLRKLFQKHRVCSFKTICQELRNMAVSISTLPKADARAAVAAASSVDGPQEELQAVISEVAVNVHGNYVLKSSLEHPEFNPLRNAVLELFLGSEPHAKIKKRQIIEAAQLKLEREPTHNEFNKVIQELCVPISGAWVFKRDDGGPN